MAQTTTFEAILGQKNGQNRKIFRKVLTFWTFEAGLFIKQGIFFTIKVVLFLPKIDQKAFWEFLLSKKIGKIFYYEKWAVYPPFGLN